MNQENGSSAPTAEVDAHVIMKILQHLGDVSPSDIPSCSGALVGLPSMDLTVITNSFAFPFSVNQSYNQEMLSNLMEDNRENLLVGFYTATLLESFLSDDFITSIHMYQKTTMDSLVLVFDYVSIFLGNLIIKAYRLNYEVIELINNRDFTPSAFSDKKISILNLLQEIPVTIKLSPLTRVLMAKIQLESSFEEPVQSFGSNFDYIINKNFNLFLASLDDLIQNSSNTYGHCRRLLRYFSTLQHQNQQEIQSGSNSVSNDNSSKASLQIPVLNRFGFFINSWNANYMNNQINSDVSNLLETLLISKEVQNSVNSCPSGIPPSS